jgi:hypothetical protein
MSKKMSGSINVTEILSTDTFWNISSRDKTYSEGRAVAAVDDQEHGFPCEWDQISWVKTMADALLLCVRSFQDLARVGQNTSMVSYIKKEVTIKCLS